MDVEEPKLEVWRHERIDDIESARLERLTGNQNQDGMVSGSGRNTDQALYQDREMSIASATTLQHLPQSRESTATVRGLSEFPNSQEHSADAMDIDEPETAEAPHIRGKQATIIVATDFGTTFSSVAYAMRENGRRPRIRMVTNYPSDARAVQGRPSVEVPTESWYPDAAKKPAEEDMVMNVDHINDEQDPDLSGTSDQEEEEDSHELGDSLEEHRHVEVSSSSNNLRKFIWGYGIQQKTTPDMDRKQFDRIARSKLMLDTSPHTEQVRKELRPVIKRLKRRRIIDEDIDVISDYLTQLFIHTKTQIEDNLEISGSTSIEHVLCVPIVWSSKALRKMQEAMKRAIRISSLGTMENLFLVSEPEAAAAYVLGQSDEVNPGEAFLILDAGGGTVDCTTYMVDKQYPLRLSKELVEPKGCLHGSSYLNEDFRKYLLTRLEDEKYLEENEYTIEGIVDHELLQFENRIKRSLDITDKNMPAEKIQVHGLRADDRKGFLANKLFVTRNDFHRIFMPHLTEITKLMRDQLTAAKEAGFRVQKVVLIGGFAASISLRNHLKSQLKVMARTYGYQIKLIDCLHTGEPETAVAHGAVLRAVNKEDGPVRITQSSYGFLRSEGFGEWPEHTGVRPTIEKLDGFKYVTNTIDWLVKKGREVPAYAEYPITAYHIFPATWKVFKCEEVLYVSDTCTESHFRRTHVKNKGKVEIAGKIVADMSFLVNEGIIQPVDPDPGFIGKRHYKIEFELVMIVEGRNLRYEARWPAGGKVRSGGQISIAAAFRPGTN